MSSKPIKKGTLSSSKSKAFAFIGGEAVFLSTRTKVTSPNFPESRDLGGQIFILDFLVCLVYLER
jgi:hypothetical protein